MSQVVKVENVSVPTFLYGTAWKEEQTPQLVKEAIRAGFRGIDTANQRKHYWEKGVGDALAELVDEGVVSREQLFLQSKFTFRAGQDHRLPYDPSADFGRQVQQSFQSSLDNLRTDYLDSYVLHGPWSGRGLNSEDFEAWDAMSELRRAGKTKLLGFSNVSLEQLQLLCEQGREKPAFVQNRCFASTGWDREMRLFCRQNSIWYQGFSLLTANRGVMGSSALQEIASNHQRTPAQVVFRFSLQVGMIPLTGTTKRQHMEQDLAVYDYELDAAEIEAIAGAGV